MIAHTPVIFRIGYEVALDNNNTVDMTGSSNDASGIYPVGSHSIRFTIADSMWKQFYVFIRLYDQHAERTNPHL